MEIEKIINLGGKDYKYKINFTLSYNLLKYKNRVQTGFDITKANKKVVEEIVAIQNKIVKEKLDEEAAEKLLANASKETQEFVINNVDDLPSKFTDEDIKFIVSQFTGITEESKIYEILDYEVINNGYEKLINKLVNEIAQVFTNAKAN